MRWFCGILLIAVLLDGGCRNDITFGSSSVIGVWELQSNDPEHFKVLIYFADNYYAYIKQDFRRKMVYPVLKYPYRVVNRDGRFFVRTEITPSIPDFPVYRSGTEVYLEERWPRPFFVLDRVSRYKKISAEEANRILRNWTLADIDFEKLPEN